VIRVILFLIENLNFESEGCVLIIDFLECFFFQKKRARGFLEKLLHLRFLLLRQNIKRLGVGGCGS